ERALGVEVYWTLPNDYDAVIYSINTGNPVILNSRCIYARELEALGAKITGLPGAVSPSQVGIGRRFVDRVKSLLGGETPAVEPRMLPSMAGGQRA
ncbi:MAG: hypothetical protein ABR527_10525, partial [Gemmatimonadota bacterium]